MIGVIVNRLARGARDPALPERLRLVLRQCGAAGEVAVPQTPDELRAVVAELCRRGVRVLACCGGDGTTMMTLSALLSAGGVAPLPRLLLLRGGTINTIARNLGVRGRPEDLLRRGLRADVATRRHDLIRVQVLDGRGGSSPPAGPIGPNGHGGGQVRHGFLFGAAMGARFLQEYYQDGAPRPLSAALLTARTIGSVLWPGGGTLARRLFAPTAVRLTLTSGAGGGEGHGDEVAEEVRLDRCRLLLCSTVADVGMGMRVTWRAGSCPRRFHLIASELPLWAMGAQLPRVFLGKPLLGRPHLDQAAGQVRVHFDEPQPFTLDGDLFVAQDLAIRSGPSIEIVV